ncbi:hypothetical protein GQ55_9G458300 [Panicum hallii var. hallii]|uniref:Uncharacterized protein n=1 Tax=Panicum hallii var. hallii TaxID=1504633 RepID=A0A2T7CC22_9POAL|nr:hypothetical protein GQ55_9G458300 [Panicum hallii var. hallii]
MPKTAAPRGRRGRHDQLQGRRRPLLPPPRRRRGDRRGEAEHGAGRARRGAVEDDAAPVGKHVGEQRVVRAVVHGGQGSAQEGGQGAHGGVRVGVQVQQLRVGGDRRHGRQGRLGRLHRQLPAGEPGQPVHGEVRLHQRRTRRRCPSWFKCQSPWRRVEADQLPRVRGRPKIKKELSVRLRQLYVPSSEKNIGILFVWMAWFPSIKPIICIFVT